VYFTFLTTYLGGFSKLSAWVGAVSQLVEHLLSMCNAMVSIPQHHKKKSQRYIVLNLELSKIIMNVILTLLMFTTHYSYSLIRIIIMENREIVPLSGGRYGLLIQIKLYLYPDSAT
jgi:hypothetical protein